MPYMEGSVDSSGSDCLGNGLFTIAQRRKQILSRMSEQVHVVTADLQPAPILHRHDRCPACSVTLAPDQRYCVECGERRGAPRLPFSDGATQHAQQAPSSRPRSGRTRSSVNSTLIAGIGTLLLAMGVGVLIGRSGAGSVVKSAGSPAVQVVTVPGVAAAATSSPEPQTPTSTAGASTSKGAAASGASATKSTGTTAKKTTPPPVKTVKVGSPGKGSGYQKGHFTGNFFGE
jgi:hypothetical protein